LRRRRWRRRTTSLLRARSSCRRAHHRREPSRGHHEKDERSCYEHPRGVAGVDVYQTSPWLKRSDSFGTQQFKLRDFGPHIAFCSAPLRAKTYDSSAERYRREPEATEFAKAETTECGRTLVSMLPRIWIREEYAKFCGPRTWLLPSARPTRSQECAHRLDFRVSVKNFVTHFASPP